jgi:hypothetical protein
MKFFFSDLVGCIQVLIIRNINGFIVTIDIADDIVSLTGFGQDERTVNRFFK